MSSDAPKNIEAEPENQTEADTKIYLLVFKIILATTLVLWLLYTFDLDDRQEVRKGDSSSRFIGGYFQTFYFCTAN